MVSPTMLRVASRPATTFLRAMVVRPAINTSIMTTTTRSSTPIPARISAGLRSYSTAHEEETFEEFTARYEKEFENVNDVFELQRNLNNSFAYDLVPSPSVCSAALKAARRLNDYPTAVRVFEGIKAKVENKNQYEQYLAELKDLREELGIDLVEDLYPPAPK